MAPAACALRPGTWGWQPQKVRWPVEIRFEVEIVEFWAIWIHLVEIFGPYLDPFFVDFCSKSFEVDQNEFRIRLFDTFLVTRILVGHVVGLGLRSWDVTVIIN